MNRKLKPDIIFLMETKNPKDFVLKKLKELDIEENCIIEPQVLGGGLALFWKKGIHITVKEGNQNYIDTGLLINNSLVHASFVYGAPDRTNRRVIWDLLSATHTDIEQPWLLTRDFNELVDSSEKV